MEIMTAALDRARLQADGAGQLAATWFDLEDWLKLMITLARSSRPSGCTGCQWS
jgi:hypothetical protein